MPRPRSNQSQRKSNQQTEAQFENTFREMASAAGYQEQFHVLNRNNAPAVKRLNAQLHAYGLPQAAHMANNTAYAKVTSPGFPDWILAHPQRGVLVAELKSDRQGSKATPEQLAWLCAFATSMLPPDNDHAPSRAHLWRPKHWPAIETQLGLINAPTSCPCAICDWMRVNSDAKTIGDELHRYQNLANAAAQ